MITQSSRGKDGISHHEFDSDMEEGISFLVMIMTHLSRVAVDGWDGAKGYWNHGYNTNSKSSLLFKVKGYDEEDRRKISSPRNFCSGKKDQVAQLKSAR